MWLLLGQFMREIKQLFITSSGHTAQEIPRLEAFLLKQFRDQNEEKSFPDLEVEKMKKSANKRNANLRFRDSLHRQC